MFLFLAFWAETCALFLVLGRPILVTFSDFWKQEARGLRHVAFFLGQQSSSSPQRPSHQERSPGLSAGRIQVPAGQAHGSPIKKKLFFQSKKTFPPYIFQSKENFIVNQKKNFPAE